MALLWKVLERHFLLYIGEKLRNRRHSWNHTGISHAAILMMFPLKILTEFVFTWHFFLDHKGNENNNWSQHFKSSLTPDPKLLFTQSKISLQLLMIKRFHIYRPHTTDAGLSHLYVLTHLFPMTTLRSVVGKLNTDRLSNLLTVAHLVRDRTGIQNQALDSGTQPRLGSNYRLSELSFHKHCWKQCAYTMNQVINHFSTSASVASSQAKYMSLLEPALGPWGLYFGENIVREPYPCWQPVFLRLIFQPSHVPTF